jgi:microcystin-dependent protein
VSDPFLSEIRLFSFGYAPRNWAQCNGQFLPINQNQALFSLLGTTFGGNGQTTFALPDLMSRVPIHVGDGHVLGEQAGQQAHTLTAAELPTHTHGVRGSTVATGGAATPNNNYLGGGNNVYASSGPVAALRPDTVTNVGGGQAHLNMQPFLTLNFCIALIGIFPSPN